MNPRLHTTLALMVAAGTVAVSVLALTGALWPYAPVNEARAHIAFANSAAIVAVLGVGLCLAAGLAICSARPAGSRLDFLPPLTAALIFMAGFLVVILHVSEALNTWFSETPMMDPVTIATVRLMMLAGLGTALIALIFFVVVKVRAILGRR